MPEETDQVFILEQGEIKSLPLRPMRLGLLGKSLEDFLQSLFEEYPSIIPGAQIDPASEDPPRFVLMRREMPVGRWSLDHLYVDQFGVLTLLETKLLQNPESRRDVIGQIVEYAANASGEWALGMARQHASEYWSKRGRDLDDVIRVAFPQSDIAQLWQDVESNLEKGRIRLIIAADSIRPEVRRMIEYLNSEMKNAEFLGLELRVYGEEQGQIILAPRIVGQTQALADQRAPSSGGVTWSVSMLREAFREDTEDEGGRLTMLLDWSVQNDCFLESRAQSPNFGLVGKTGDRIVGIPPSGVLYLYFEDHRYSDGTVERDRIVSELKAMSFLSAEIDPAEVVHGRSFIRSLSELDQEEFNELLEFLSSICRLPDGSA